MQFIFEATAFVVIASLLLYFLPLNVHGFILRSQVSSAEQCVEAEAERCFYKLFGQMSNICSDSELTFRCHHYKFLDECFAREVGICPANQVGRHARLAYRKRQVICDRQNQKQYREATRRRPTSLSRPGPPNELQFISLFGYLQTQCSIAAHENCSTGRYQGMIETCEEEIRAKAASSNSDFDRHQILRLKLDTSKKLLEYPETRRDDECLVVRSTLSDIYRIHHRYCFQAVITRCLCEQLGFERSCGVDCSVIEPSGPREDRLAWSDFKGRLISSHATECRILLNIPSVFLHLYFLLVLG